MVLLKLLRYREADQSLQTLGRSLQQKPQNSKAAALVFKHVLQVPVAHQPPPPQSSTFGTFWPNPRQHQNWAQPGSSVQNQAPQHLFEDMPSGISTRCGKNDGWELSKPRQPSFGCWFLGPALPVLFCLPQTPPALFCQNKWHFPTSITSVSVPSPLISDQVQFCCWSRSITLESHFG